MQTITIPRVLLADLIEAADYGQDQRAYDAQRSRKEGEDETAREQEAAAKRWRFAVRLALKFQREPIPVMLRPMRMEVSAPRRGRPGYRWTNGYLVIDPNTGNEIHPPARLNEARELARKVAQGPCRIVIEKSEPDPSRMRAALEEIAQRGPKTEPEPEDYDDTESAYNNGGDVADWECSRIALRGLGRA